MGYTIAGNSRCLGIPRFESLKRSEGVCAVCQFTSPGTQTHHGDVPTISATEGVLC
jgi:hypothetical protein